MPGTERDASERRETGYRLSHVEPDISRHAILQPISSGKCRAREEGSGSDGPGDQGHAETDATGSGLHEPGQLRRIREHMNCGGSDPDDEARLVQADERPFRLAEDE